MLEKTPSGTKLTGFYRGIVKAHSINGRCKIFWPGVSPSEWKDDSSKINLLPDAEQAAPLFASGNNGNGTFCYPDVGSTVWGFFENGDMNYPVYFAATLSFNDNSQTYNDSLKRNATSVERDIRIIKISNLTITINAQDGSIAVDNGEGSIVLSKDGRISLSTSNDISIRGNNVTIAAAKDININSTNIKAIASENIDTFSQRNNIQTTGGGTSIKGDLPFYGLQIW